MEYLNLKIKEIRKSKGLTLDQVARQLGMTKANLSRIEKGVVGFSTEKIAALAQIYDISVEELLNFESATEKLIKQGHPSALSELLEVKNEQIQRMQQSSELFILQLLHFLRAEISKKKEPYFLIKKETYTAIEALFNLPGIVLLLNGENTTKGFPLLNEFNEYWNNQLDERMMSAYNQRQIDTIPDKRDKQD